MKWTAMLDSGAFSAFNKGVDIDLGEYADFVRRHGHLFTAGSFNLDVIGDGQSSYRNWVKLRSMGVETIPVYHINSDVKWLKRYAKKSDSVAIGALVGSAFKNSRMHYTLDRLWKILDEIEFKCVHGLGLTVGRTLSRYPWTSVDSSAAVKAGAFGYILIPAGVVGLEGRIRRKSMAAAQVDPEQCIILYVTSARFHSVGSLRSFYAYPAAARARIKKYVEGFGFILPESAPRSEQRSGKYNLGLMNEIKHSDLGECDLSTSRSARCRLNYISLGHSKCKIYHVIIGNKDLKDMEAVIRQTPFRVLFSYWFLRKGFRDLIISKLKLQKKKEVLCSKLNVRNC